MKICILIKDSAINGGNRVAFSLATHMGLFGHEVCLCISRFGAISPFKISKFTVIDPKAAQHEAYDCAICTYFSEAGLFRQISAEKKFRYVQANYWKDGQEHPERQRAADEYFRDDSLNNIAVSSYIQNVLIRKGINSCVVRPTIDQDAFSFEPQLCDGKFRVLVEGTMNRWKRLGESITSVPPDIEVWCLSPQPTSVKAERYWVNPQQAVLPKIMSACNLIVKLSEMEGYPLILLESMKCGVVPVVLDSGGQLDYCFDGQNSFYVSSAREVPLVIEHYMKMSPQARSELSKNAIATVSARTWSDVAEDFLSVIESETNTCPY